MKRQLFFSLASALLSLGFAVTAFAQTPEDTKTKAMDWIQSRLEGPLTKEFLGYTPSGQRCGLYLTDRSFAGDRDYYVVVGYFSSRDLNDYIGMSISVSTVSQADFKLSFTSNESWGNGSHTNQVTVDLNAEGKPLQAKGVSDLKTIDCKLD